MISELGHCQIQIGTIAVKKRTAPGPRSRRPGVWGMWWGAGFQTWGIVRIGRGSSLTTVEA
jgi:hypothetical protein